uniref:Ribosomal protein L7Ae/L30e/S12e/Gadd45 domain-containing protein n=1 Tax=Clastoptera arizonana TaxID=38151 RepID=A0A1B6DB25_9HEMI
MKMKKAIKQKIITIVMRGLEKDEISCCLLAKEVEPQILLKNMVMLAQNKQVPVVIIPSLKDVLKKTLSFSAMSLGIKNTVEGDSNCLLHPIIKLVQNMNEKFSRTEKQYQQTSSPKKIESTRVHAITRTECKTNYHLQISSPRGPRVFIPPRIPSTDCDVSTDNIKNSLLYIPISKDDSDSDKPNPKENKTSKFHKFAEESDNDDDIASDEELFKIDTNPDNSMQEMSEELKLKPKQLIKRKAEKELNIGYIPTKIKVTKSNLSKLKKKNKT